MGTTLSPAPNQRSLHQPMPQQRMPPYSPSWLNRLMAWLHRLPGASWRYYALTFVLYLVAGHLVRWLEGDLPWGTLALGTLVPALWGPGLIAVTDYLDNVAIVSLLTLRPALKIDEEGYNRLAYELTTMPPRGTLLASLVWLAMGLILLVVTAGTVASFFSVGEVALYAPTFFSTGAIIYHTLYQLRVVSRIYAQIQHVNIFQLEPLHAFSALTARTAGSWILLSYVTALLVPSPISLGGFGITLLVAVLLALLVFILPLAGVHHLLVREKERQLAEVNRRLEETVKHLYQLADTSLDDSTPSRIDAMNTLLTSLITTRTLVESISTWPWQPGTIQGLLTTILLPIALWLIQFFLQRLLTLES